MSNLTPGRGRGPMLPAPPPGHPIATYRTYLEAQRAVDYLSDEKFPVQHVSIVGTDLKMVERVTGRLTYGRVALAGALSGALKAVSASQNEATALQREVHLENPNVSLEQTMVAIQKAQIGFQATMHVRNRMVQAYTDIMNMQV